MRATHQHFVSVRLPRDLNDRVDKIARLEYESRSNVLRRLIRAGLDAQPQPRGTTERKAV